MNLFATVGTQLIEGRGLDACPGNSWQTFVQEFRSVPQTLHAVGEIATQLAINSFETDKIDELDLDIVLCGFVQIAVPPLDKDELYHFDLGSDRAKIANGISVS